MTDELKEAVERVTALAASWEASSSSREDWHEALPDDVRADMAADAEALRTVLKAAARPVAPAVPAGVREALEAARMVLANEATSGAEWRSAEVRVAAALAAIAQPEGGAASTSEGVREALEWTSFADRKPKRGDHDDMGGEEWLLTWNTRAGAYDIGCIDGNWSYGEEIDGHKDDLWAWLPFNPAALTPPAESGGEQIRRASVDQPKAERLLLEQIARAATNTETVDGLEVWATQQRFFIDHNVIHDRETGKHVRTDTPDWLNDDGIDEALSLLNGMWDYLVSLKRDYQQLANHPAESGGEPQPSVSLCEDCPPVGYPTDKTRCLPCPRREPQPQPSGEVRDGWVTVPREPTEAMERAFWETQAAAETVLASVPAVWGAMLAAAPDHSKAEG